MIDVMIIFVLAALVGLAVWSILKRKKAGGGCGCGCAGCSRAGFCHPQDKALSADKK